MADTSSVNDGYPVFGGVWTPPEPPEPEGPDPDDNTVSVNPSITAPGTEVVITAEGSMQNETPTNGCLRYVPVSWTSDEVGASGGTFTLSAGSYTANYVPAAVGTYTITALFRLQSWMDGEWYNAPDVVEGATDTKTTVLIVRISVPPTVNTGEVTDVTDSAASLSGSVTTDGGAAVTERGFVYGTSINPAVGDSDVNKAISGSGIGAFTASVSSLTPSTTYHVRAYATNSAGTSYGANVTWTTLSNVTEEPERPTVNTGEVTDVTDSAASLSGSVTTDGGAAVTERGFVYGTSINPAVGGSDVNKAISGSGIGAFTASVSSLTPSTTYHVRAYATNSAGTSYGANVTWTTLSNVTEEPERPTVNTGEVTGVTASAASMSGSVTMDGGAAVTERGFVYGTSMNPTVGGSDVNKAISGSGTGAFTASVSSLTPSTTYHVRAYATNSAGTSYGANVTWTTLPVITGLPDSESIYTGARFTLNPSPAGGQWKWDSAYVTLTESGGTVEIKGVKVGTTIVTYTVGGVSKSITVIIQASELPQTGQNFVWVWVLGGAAIAAAGIAWLIWRGKAVKQ